MVLRTIRIIFPRSPFGFSILPHSNAIPFIEKMAKQYFIFEFLSAIVESLLLCHRLSAASTLPAVPAAVALFAGLRARFRHRARKRNAPVRLRELQSVQCSWHGFPSPQIPFTDFLALLRIRSVSSTSATRNAPTTRSASSVLCRK